MHLVSQILSEKAKKQGLLKFYHYVVQSHNLEEQELPLFY